MLIIDYDFHTLSADHHAATTRGAKRRRRSSGQPLALHLVE